MHETQDALDRLSSPSSPSSHSSPTSTATPGSSYTRSLLKIKTPIAVTLASTRLPVSRILEIGPGSIISFEKSCDDPLTLEVGGQPVAYGETVKVGEKFGLRVTAMVMPSERLKPLEKRG